MKGKIIWTILGFLMVVAMVLASCGKTTPTTTPTTTPPTTTSTTTAPPTTKPPTTTPTTGAKWWDKFGTPQYGGTITYGLSYMDVTFDNMTFVGTQWDYWWEPLFTRSWTYDRSQWDFKLYYTPDEATVGCLVESWEMTDPVTITLHIRKGVTWQNKPPTNGREFTADDVAQHYARQMGSGYGYTQPATMNASYFVNWASVTTTDKYTIIFKFKQPSALNYNSIALYYAPNLIEAPEAVKLEGELFVIGRMP